MTPTYQHYSRLQNQKQDKITTVKVGLFTPGDGQDGDIGICKHLGKTFFAIKTLGEWWFSEAYRAQNLNVQVFTVKK